MPTLYEINEAKMKCFDAETGELIDVEGFEQWEATLEEKIENVALHCKNMNAENEAIEQEIKNLEKRLAQNKKSLEGYKRWLVIATEGHKFHTAKVVVSTRSSTAVEIIDKSIIPADYLVTKTTVSVDKVAIKTAITEGTEVKGATIVENTNVTIK